ncbi:Smr/MutS family protein [Desulfuromonas sp. TF]|uniref:Smr/MutS family protein n=1 Tax=Desulfuromonas sp. TF TaxID=1232410 RepID=UPI0004273DB5|nr:Smr/MutS family protein [Desulfuromonas sp. TF]
MSARKNRDNSVDGTKSFQANPFKKLKGFAASAPPEKDLEKKGKTAAPPPAGEDDAILFAEEMSRLGVKRGKEEKSAPPEKVSGEEDVAASVPAATDRELFLDALKGMDTVFEDAFPPDEEVLQQALPRRMKLLRQGRLAPEAEIDLHGLTREQARTKVGYFLEDSVYQGKKTVLIVTGRGKGSGGEPVLRAEVEQYLATGAGEWVSEWGRAPRRYGGEGALVVFLTGKSKRI